MLHSIKTNMKRRKNDVISFLFALTLSLWVLLVGLLDSSGAQHQCEECRKGRETAQHGPSHGLGPTSAGSTYARLQLRHFSLLFSLYCFFFSFGTLPLAASCIQISTLPMCCLQVALTPTLSSALLCLNCNLLKLTLILICSMKLLSKAKSTQWFVGALAL